MTIGIAILTLNAERDLPRLLTILDGESGWDRILIVDSASTDRTEAIARKYPHFEWLQIPRKTFNHGATREMARKHLATDIVVFLTQDVLPLPGFLKRLVDPVKTGRASVAYARQLPHIGADLFESFPRDCNYGSTVEYRSLADAKRLGVMTFACSDSASAYANAALDSIGGFAPILTNEDYFAVAELVRRGHVCCYMAEAEVRHSHRYTLKQEFQRYFDNGYVRGIHPWVTRLVGHAEGHGKGFAKKFVKQVASRIPMRLPYLVLQMAAKWLGYRLGTLGPRLPKRLCRFFSPQKYYWDSIYSTHPRVFDGYVGADQQSH